MAGEKLIKKVCMDCPICDKMHEVEEKSRVAAVMVKGEKVKYDERFYYCVNADEEENEFVTGKMMDENLLNARNAYRKSKGLLTSDDIVLIRENYGLSQTDLSKLLGWGDVTVARYETKAIQDEAYDTMLCIVKDNPLQTLELFRRNSSKFSEMKRAAIRAKILEKLNLFGKERLSRQSLECEYACYEEPSDSNGFTLLNIDKIEAAISYMAIETNNLFKVKLMKMLWYADALSFKKSGHAITGLVYRHNQMGALPIGHYELMNLEKLNVQEEPGYDCDTVLHIYPVEGMDYGALTSDEIETLDEVIKKFKDYNAKKIVNYMHEETAYTGTAPGEVIPFSLAKEIREF